MQKNKLKGLWSSGKPILNAWCSIGNSFTAEIMASQGYDSVTVDIQHGALDYSHVSGDAILRRNTYGSRTLA